MLGFSHSLILKSDPFSPSNSRFRGCGRAISAIDSTREMRFSSQIPLFRSVSRISIAGIGSFARFRSQNRFFIGCFRERSSLGSQNRNGSRTCSLSRVINSLQFLSFFHYLMVKLLVMILIKVRKNLIFCAQGDILDSVILVFHWVMFSTSANLMYQRFRRQKKRRQIPI